MRARSNRCHWPLKPHERMLHMGRVTKDVKCDGVFPWCYLCKARMELSIAEVQDEVSFDVNWRPYQLNPDIPPEGVDHHKYLAEKLGGAEAVRQAHDRLREFGKEVGVDFDFEAARIGPNTLAAHRLILWAKIGIASCRERVCQ